MSIAMKGRVLSEDWKRKIGQSNSIALKGRKLSEEHRAKSILNLQPENWRGKHFSEEHKAKIKNARKGIMRYNWKGDRVGYHALHNWVARWRGKPDTCEHCGRTNLSGRAIHWANKSGKYLRKLSDWLRLCVPCHKQYDIGRANA